MEIRRNIYSIDGELYGNYKLVKNYSEYLDLDSYFSYLEDNEYYWCFLHYGSDDDFGSIYTPEKNRYFIKFEPEHLI